MEYSIGDLWDRWTIEYRKNLYGADNLHRVIKIQDAIIAKGFDDDYFQVAKLAMANDSIAVLEWQIRADHKLSDEEVGLRAREVRKINERRVLAKNALDGQQVSFTEAFGIPIEKLTLAIPDAAK